MGHADHTKGTGNGGVMLIRVADAAGTPGVIGGNEVQFHIRAGLSSTYVGSPGFRWDGYINGGWGDPTNWRGRIGNISGTTWRHVATFYIGYTQDVCFRIDYSGTQGFGGPTDFWVAVGRATVPATPNTPNVSNLQADRMTLSWNIPADNGAGIDQMLLRQSSTLDFSSYIDHPRGGNVTSAEIAGLTPGATYYWRVYAHNSQGYSGSSGVRTQATRTGGRRKVDGVWRDIERWRKVDGAWRRVVRWRKVDGAWRRTR
ncbi:fibronectin type III domain-containing protein [Streptomyces albidoflavus]